MGTQSVIPLLVYEDMEAAQRFLVDVFGFKEGRLVRDASGRPFHAEVHAGDSVIWIHRVAPQHGLVSARSLPAQPGGLVVFVDDIDAHYHHAKSAGARIDSTPTDQPYGQREYSVGIRRGTSGTSQRGYGKTILSFSQTGNPTPRIVQNKP